MKRLQKITCVLLAIFFLGTCAFSQSRYELKGDKLKDMYRYLAASEAYHKALASEDNDRIKLKLADCYRMLNDPESSSKWYGKAFEKNIEADPIDKYNYALALTGIGEFEEAEEWFKSYMIDVPEDERSLKYLEQFRQLEKLYEDSSLYVIKRAPFNSTYSDFSPALFKDDIVFISARKAGLSQFKWDGSAFLDLYISYRNSLGIFSLPASFHKKINSKFHEGPVSFYSKGSKMVLTRNNFEKGRLGNSAEGISKLKIYFSAVDREGEWKEVTSFPFNNDEYSVGHPSISENGSTLYFISDMSGGLGGTDIYVSYKQGNNWSEPKNMGPKINTKGNEMFPYIDGAKQLIFASNGHGGLGGLDLFTYDFENAKISNFGYPINSEKDDFGLIFDSTNSGFFSSNRGTDDGTDNIYRFDIVKPTIYPIMVEVFEKDSKVPVSNASISVDVFGSSSQNIIKTDRRGVAEIPMELHHQYYVRATKDGYEDEAKYITPKTGSESVTLRLAKNCNYVKGFVKILGDNEESDKISAILTSVITKKSDSSSLVDNGFYEFCVEPESSYILRIEKENYFAKTIRFSTSTSESLTLDDVMLNEIVIDKAIQLENIYYDVGKWNIRKDAATELEKLVRLLEDNPTIEIELSSHTDARGSDSFNLTLSQKRAKSAGEYIVSKGIETRRVTTRGYGETALLNKCSNGVSCTSEEHQANRRTEFKVLRF